MGQCFHPEKWQESEECDLCRYREALEKIPPMLIRGDILVDDPNDKRGRIIGKIAEIAFNALYPKWFKKSEGK